MFPAKTFPKWMALMALAAVLLLTLIQGSQAQGATKNLDLKASPGQSVCDVFFE